MPIENNNNSMNCDNVIIDITNEINNCPRQCPGAPRKRMKITHSNNNTVPFDLNDDNESVRRRLIFWDCSNILST
jgi:hypothetical protein